MAPSAEELHARARRLRLILLDVDGVLTDGTVSIHSAGGESKAFHIRDGAAIVWARREDLEIGLLSGRPSEATSRRAAELGIKLVFQAGPDKVRGYRDILDGAEFRGRPGGLHGRRSAGPRGARSRGPVGGAGRRRRRKCGSGFTG